eukprot:152816-Pyramimonas_sp.AAC.1
MSLDVPGCPSMSLVVLGCPLMSRFVPGCPLDARLGHAAGEIPRARSKSKVRAVKLWGILFESKCKYNA